MTHSKHTQQGFTLIEMLVSVSIFVMVMLVATGAVFSIVGANKKTHSLKSVMTNLDFALESITRNIRVGTNYSCIDASGFTQSDPTAGNCRLGNVGIHLTSNIAIGPNAGNYPLEYIFKTDSNGVGRIYRQFLGLDSAALPITASEVNIQSMKFYVTGSGIDQKQPRVVITVQGYAGVGETQSNFNIETTVSERSIDQ